MKKELRGFIVGMLVIVMLMGTVAFAGGVKQKIDVIFNAVNLEVNGKPVKADSILYNGTTYVPIRAVSEILDKEVGWDEKTNTASINDKRNETPAKDIAGKYEYVSKDENGKVLYSFKINKITTMNERNQFSDKNPAQVLLIDYTYKNIANPEEVYLSEIHFKVIDSKGKIGYTYPNSPTNYPQHIPIGASCDAQMIFGTDNLSEKITLNFYENMFGNMTTSFEIPVE
jgi:hypothetical protein